MIYLALDSVALSRQRVAERVQHGGHDIPLVDIERRFPRSLDNLLNRFSQVVDLCRCYMNGGTTPELIFKQSGDDRNVVHAGHFQRLQRESSL
jgi:predicted ABC-type ATPase